MRSDSRGLPLREWDAMSPTLTMTESRCNIHRAIPKPEAIHLSLGFTNESKPLGILFHG
jgi:hypothetical protein